MAVFDDLVGKKIVKFLVNDSEDLMSFVTDDGEVISYFTEGDCCNYVWLCHISGIGALLGNVVNRTEDKEWVQIEATELMVGGDECEEMGFWTIMTDKGYFDLEVRNSHNGYYGGCVSKNDSDVDLSKLREITEDF